MARVIIRAGDTLRTISQRLGINPEDIYNLNPTLTQTGLIAGSALELPEGVVPIGSPASQPSTATGMLTGEVAEAPFMNAIKYILGQGVGLGQAESLAVSSPLLQSMFEGVFSNITRRTEDTTGSALATSAPTPLEFLRELERTGTLSAILDKSNRFRETIPALTSRRLRI